MKNDYRDYIEHSDTNHRYIRKVKTKSGEWRYIYPEDIKNKLADTVNAAKRNADYAYRNLKYKVTGNNKTFKLSNPYSNSTNIRDNKVMNRRNAEQLIANEKEQRKSRQALAKYNERVADRNRFNQMDVSAAKKKKHSKDTNSAVMYERIQREARAKGELGKKFHQMDELAAKKKKHSKNVNSAIMYEKIQREARAKGEAAKKERKNKYLNNFTSLVKETRKAGKEAKKNKEQTKKENAQKIDEFIKGIKSFSTTSKRRRKK